jgi:hypothetical protein
VVAFGLVAAAAACGKDLRADLDRLTEARLLVADLSVQFVRLTEATDRAVMAGSDETTAASQRAADQAATAIDQDRDRLKADLGALSFAKEAGLLDEFGTRWGQYRAVNRNVLDLARESSNLKAQQLAFGPAQEAADACVTALDRVRPASAANEWRVRALVATASAGVREVQALEGPHIAEPGDARMTVLEGRMAEASKSATGAITSLAGLASPHSAAHVATARQSLARFLDVHAQLLSLSRRNSNVRAVAMSLGQARLLAAACEESLRALGDALAQRTDRATR